MANSTNINNPETTTNAQIQGAGLVLPLSVNERSPNKISTLFTPNSSVLYSKYSPYPEGQSGGFFGANQPYIVTNINDANKGINSTLKYAPLQPAATIDVVRVTKYSASNPGIKFLLKQIYLQGYQPFNETKLYNPLMPIQATLRVASFGILDRPLRHIEPNLSGVLGILGVKGIAGAFGFNPPNPPPRGTAPGKNGGLFELDKPLSITNPGDGKGLTRGGTATSAYSGQNYSYLSRPSRTGFLQNIGNFFKSSTLFGTFFAIGQPAGTIYKGDDNTYSLMLESKRIVSLDKSGVNTYGTNGVVQRWDADKDRSAALFYQTNPSKFSRYLTQYSSGFDYLQSKYSNQSFNIDVNSFKITDGKPKNLIGYNSYADAVGILLNGTETSDMLFLYNDYLKNNNYPTKLKSPRKIDSIIHDSYKKGYVIEDGGYIKETGILNSLGKPIDKSPIIANEYKDYIDPNFTETSYPTKLTSLDNILTVDNIYTREQIDQIKHNPSGQGYVIDPNGQTIGYEDVTVNTQTKKPYGEIEKSFLIYEDDTLSEYPTTFIKGETIFGQEQIDFANTQNQKLKRILESNYTFVAPTNLKKLRSIIDSDEDVKKNSLSYLAKYKKYKNGKDLLDNPDGKGFAGVNQSDLINILSVQSNTTNFIDRDLIKFYFYDVYNQKYIPFRATVKAISERSVSTWDDFQYIGNADKVYNYKGFTRGLGFSFNVVAMSVKEMLPMWQRINYLMGLTKPANYKNGFIVPPLVMLTIGDIYNNQPIVINSINMTIPDNATWETVSDDSYKISQFQYLNGRLKLNKLVALAQFPREAEISIDANILEKETPKVGRNNFGDVNMGGLFVRQLSVVTSEKEIRQEEIRKEEIRKEEIRQEGIRKQEEFNARRTGEIDMMEVG